MLAGAKEYIALTGRRRALEEELKEVVGKLEELSGILAESMAMEGIQRVTYGDATLFIRRDRYCNKRPGVSMEQLCEVLRRTDLSYLVAETYNASALKARIREMEEHGETVPESLAEVLSMGEVQRVIVNRAG